MKPRSRGKKSRLAVAVIAALGMRAESASAADDADHRSDISTRAELGQQLFFDPVLSKDHSMSCASCHKPEHAFADTSAVSTGVGGAKGRRNTPSAMNTAARVQFFWDGRASSLEEQALGPIANPLELALPVEEALARINADAQYAQAFQQLFSSPATAKTLGKAIAAFEKTLETSNSPYDRYAKGDDHAMSPEAVRGRLLFIGKANCSNCHSGEDFTSDRFKNIGLYNGRQLNDSGRAEITNNPEDAGSFKVPSLRNVAVTAPYMHNGVFKTLREVIDYYNDPAAKISDARHRDPVLGQSLGLSEQEKSDLEAFLEALTDDRFRGAAAPQT